MSEEQPMPNPVSPEKIQIARDFGLFNVQTLATASRIAEVPFAVACALMEKESKGRNIYGHDQGGALSTAHGPVEVGGLIYPKDSDIPVLPVNAAAFLIMIGAGATSNGMGPGQITWAGELADGRSGGFFRDMGDKGLVPWYPLDNMTYGLELLHDYKAVHGATWEDAGTKYNGHRSYGIDFARLCGQWFDRLNP